MTTQDHDGDGLLTRAELEIELARLVLAIERRRATAQGAAELSGWFECACADLLDRLAPELKPFCLERLQQIAESNAGLELSGLELQPNAVSFVPASPSDEARAP